MAEVSKEVEIVRVALPKILRKSGKKFAGIKHSIVGRGVINLHNTKENPNAGFIKLGDEGWMTKADYEAKDYAKYGLKSYFENEGKAELVNSISAENSELQDNLMAKDAEIEKLKAQLAGLGNGTVTSENTEYSDKTLVELKAIAEEKGVDVRYLNKQAVIDKLLLV